LAARISLAKGQQEFFFSFNGEPQQMLDGRLNVI
jgi:hypothetical protein